MEFQTSAMEVILKTDLKNTLLSFLPYVRKAGNPKQWVLLKACLCACPHCDLVQLQDMSVELSGLVISLPHSYKFAKHIEIECFSVCGPKPKIYIFLVFLETVLNRTIYLLPCSDYHRCKLQKKLKR
jgi:hypothetical protein